MEEVVEAEVASTTHNRHNTCLRLSATSANCPRHDRKLQDGELRKSCQRTISTFPVASTVGSQSKWQFFKNVLFWKSWLQKFTLAYCQPRSRGDGCAASGVCLTRSERFGHGQLLTHGILQMVKFKQDLSRP